MAEKSKGKLTVTTRGETELVLSRVFDAPRHLVFEVMTKPEHVRRWWGGACDEITMASCEMDFRVGGRWRIVTKSPDGSECAFHGEYREIAAPERFVQTEVLEPYPEESAAIDTATFVEKAGKTHYEMVCVFVSKEVRDMVLASGMEIGTARGLDLVEEIARSLAPSRDAAAPASL